MGAAVPPRTISAARQVTGPVGAALPHRGKRGTQPRAQCSAAGSVLWLAGEEHRKNCQTAGRTECSVLPWDAGKRIAATPDTPDPREKHMTRDACELLNARLSANGTPDADLYDCALSPTH